MIARHLDAGKEVWTGGLLSPKKIAPHLHVAHVNLLTYCCQDSLERLQTSLY